jgi:hypothetical protein
MTKIGYTSIQLNRGGYGLLLLTAALGLGFIVGVLVGVSI